MVLILVVSPLIPLSKAKNINLPKTRDPALTGYSAAVWDFIAAQSTTTVSEIPITEYPMHSVAYESWYTRDAHSWTSGFFPGCLWLLHEKTGLPVQCSRVKTLLVKAYLTFSAKGCK